MELNRLARAVRELGEIKSRLQDNPSSTIEVTAAGALLAQFYAGFERILRRIAVYHDVEMPTGRSRTSTSLRCFDRLGKDLEIFPHTD